MSQQNTGVMNVSHEALEANIRANVVAGHRAVTPGCIHGHSYVLLAGGPSMNAHTEEIREKSRHLPIVVVNGSYQWCLSHGIHPTAMVMVDARASNIKFIPAVSLTCQYFLASQVHPDVFAAVPPSQTWMWHNDATPEIAFVLDWLLGAGQWHPIKGGPTVTLRALSLFRLMGWLDVDVYGMDGSFDTSGKGYAYDQKVEGESIVITFRKKRFATTYWLITQAQDFLLQMGAMPDLHVLLHGDNLMTHMINTSREPPSNVLAVDH